MMFVRLLWAPAQEATLVQRGFTEQVGSKDSQCQPGPGIRHNLPTGGASAGGLRYD